MIYHTDLFAPIHARLREIFDESVEKHGWGGCTYDTYRVQVPFPMMHGLVRLVVRPNRGSASA